MKKYYRFALGILVATALTACGGENKSSKEEDAEQVDATEVVEETETIYADDSIAAPVKEEVRSSNTAEWDEVLDSYEKYVDKYLSVMKKSQSGDLSAIADMASLQSEMEKFTDKLENASDDMTPAQMARYQKITMKMASAAY